MKSQDNWLKIYCAWSEDRDGLEIMAVGEMEGKHILSGKFLSTRQLQRLDPL